MTAAVTALRLWDEADKPIEAVVMLVPPKKRGMLAPDQIRITLPGFMMFCGSSARFRERMVSSSTLVR